jgi:hypothetical protein
VKHDGSLLSKCAKFSFPGFLSIKDGDAHGLIASSCGFGAGHRKSPEAVCPGLGARRELANGACAAWKDTLGRCNALVGQIEQVCGELLLGHVSFLMASLVACSSAARRRRASASRIDRDECLLAAKITAARRSKRSAE